MRIHLSYLIQRSLIWKIKKKLLKLIASWVTKLFQSDFAKSPVHPNRVKSNYVELQSSIKIDRIKWFISLLSSFLIIIILLLFIKIIQLDYIWIASANRLMQIQSTSSKSFYSLHCGEINQSDLILWNQMNWNWIELALNRDSQELFGIFKDFYKGKEDFRKFRGLF